MSHSKLDRFLQDHPRSAASFARAIGVQPPQLSRIRRGRAQPTLAQAVAIARESGGAVPVDGWVEGHGVSFDAARLSQAAERPPEVLSPFAAEGAR